MEALPFVCLEFYLLTVQDLKAEMNWNDSDLWNQRALPERGLARYIMTKATKPEL